MQEFLLPKLSFFEVFGFLSNLLSCHVINVAQELNDLFPFISNR